METAQLPCSCLVSVLTPALGAELGGARGGAPRLQSRVWRPEGPAERAGRSLSGLLGRSLWILGPQHNQDGRKKAGCWDGGRGGEHHVFPAFLSVPRLGPLWSLRSCRPPGSLMGRAACFRGQDGAPDGKAARWRQSPCPRLWTPEPGPAGTVTARG